MDQQASTQDSSNKFPEHARVVIIGGGVIGCSVAYHLSKLGWKDVVLLERAQLTAGTTWHAAGLIEAGGFFSETIVGMAKYTLELYSQLEVETGQSTGYKAVGMFQIANTESRLHELRRITQYDNYKDVPLQEITPEQIKELWPLAYTDDILAGFYTAIDGRVNPIDVTMALAKGARIGGVQILEDTPVTGFIKDYSKVTGVVTEKGIIQAEYVVNCAGMWARQLGKMAGVNVPLQPTEHYYLITEPIEGINGELPVLVDLDKYAYYREEIARLIGC